MIITGPGFYTSKAGKCEAETESKDGLFAFGKWNSLPVIWRKRDGMAIAAGWCSNLEALNITSAFIEPRKPVEAWAVSTCCWADPELYGSEDAAKRRKDGMPPHYFARLVHLRDVEDTQP